MIEIARPSFLRHCRLVAAVLLSAAIAPAVVAKDRGGASSSVKSAGNKAVAKEKAPPKPKPEPYLKYELQNVTITSYSTSRSAPKGGERNGASATGNAVRRKAR